jgi:DNA-binding transcriptional ArsR family regulator
LNKVFDALASDARRQILAYLADDELTAGEIAARFSMSKPAISKHLAVLENAGLVTSEKRGQYVWYAIEREQLNSAIAAFLRTVALRPAVAAKTPRPASPTNADRRSPCRLDRPGEQA